MDDWKSAFAEEWDAVVLGTGMKECLLSGLLSVAGKKVLHLDRNPYYGGASASLDVNQLFSKFGVADKPGAPRRGTHGVWSACCALRTPLAVRPFPRLREPPSP